MDAWKETQYPMWWKILMIIVVLSIIVLAYVKEKVLQ